MDLRQTLLTALHTDPGDATAWLALADCLEEQDEGTRAELLRAQLVLNRVVDGQRNKAGAERKACERRVQQLLADGVRPCVPTLTFALTKTVNLELGLVPAGTFWMGARGRERGRFSDELPRHRVTITRPFYIGLTPVTQAQWRAVMRRSRGYFQGDDRPADSVNADDCEAFCRDLSKKTGRRACLPTEAEWEYACRAGTTTRFASGNEDSAMARIGWCDRERTEPVGQLQPNGWGLHDMHGSVWEWCQDSFVMYSGEEQTDPMIPGDDRLRVARGGSYSNPENVCRSACRIGFAAGGRNDFIGCRVVVEWGA